MNTPAIESVLEKVPEESIKELFGPNGVTPVDRDIAFTDLLTARLDRPIELFPYLMILVLLFFAVEGFVANRFYRLRA